jgi:2-succinyl-6-hydroxy-2,4-cyclohexadiene-1-carboxylate synthase
VTPPLVLLHGFTGSGRSWGAVGAALGPGRACHALPLLGHAPDLVEGPEATFEDEVDRVARAVRAIAPVVDVAGYSLGARVALGLCVRHPARIRRVVLVGVNPGLETDEDRRARARADEAEAWRLETEGLAAFVDRWEALPLFETQRALPDAILHAQRQERLAHDARGLARSLRVTGLGRMPSAWADLPALAGRVHLVVGALDEKFRAIAERAAREAAVPVSLMPGAGHNVPLEAPERLARLLDEVLA